MSTKDISEMLGLEDTPFYGKDMNFGENTKARGSSDHTLKLDDWDKEQGNRLMPSLIDKIIQKTMMDEKWENTLSDFHGSVYKADPTLSDKHCESKRREEFVKQMMETPEYKTLRKSTVLDKLCSELATGIFAERFSKLLDRDQRQNEKRQKKKKRDPEREQLQDEMACLKAAGQALAQAQEDVDIAQELGNSLLPGDEQGQGGKFSLERTVEIFKQVRNSDLLRAIMEKAGRWRRVAQTCQQNKVLHGRDDIVGVELSGDVARLVPHELMLLADDDLEYDALRRLVEQQSMSRRYQGIENVGKGPIILCIDESGSMSGPNIENAKAFALSMYWVARHQNRPIVLVGFEHGVACSSLGIKPNDSKDKELLEWLQHFYNGGTSLHVPLQTVPRLYETSWKEYVTKGKTDLIIVTDGIVDLGQKIKDDYLKWKEENKVRTISIVLADEAGPMPEVSDEVHLVNSVSIGEEGFLSAMSI